MADFNYRSPLAASVANPRRMNRIAASAAARRACRSVDPNRHDNLKLLFVAPPAPTFLPKNLDTHHIPHPRHVANDVVKHVS